MYGKYEADSLQEAISFMVQDYEAFYSREAPFTTTVRGFYSDYSETRPLDPKKFKISGDNDRVEVETVIDDMPKGESLLNPTPEQVIETAIEDAFTAGFNFAEHQWDADGQAEVKGNLLKEATDKLEVQQ